MESLETSFDGSEGLDASSVLADELYGLANKDPEYQTQQHIKKLSEAFEGCVRPDTSQMKVFLRIRPIQSTASSKTEQGSTIQVNNATTITTVAPDTSRRAQYTKIEERNYMFTRVFPPNTEQVSIFNDVGKPLLERFLRGESCVLFAYGMTNSGKTYTIQGQSNDPGLLPRLVDSILSKIATENHMSSYELNVSMLEIYQEKVFDLLSKKRDKLTIRDGNGHVEVVKLSTNTICSSADAVRLLDIAAGNRSKANTLLNAGSSRSHAVYTLTLKQGRDSSIYSVFHVVDLAGAERGNRTKANFLQLKEANNINVSLMQLWRCLQGMKRKVSADGSSTTGNDPIPYRESKLTHLLMPELGRAGTAGVAMVTCVNPQCDDYDETISILSNASLACKITELADIGRPAVQSQSTTSTAPQSMISSLFSHFNGSNNDSNQRNLWNKRKRDENSVASSGPPAIATVQAMKRSAQIATANANATKAMRKNSVTITASQSTAATSTTEASQEDGSHDSDQEIKRLRLEVQRLETENVALMESQLQRETEVRCEIASEMQKRSDSLLKQIKSLQTQLVEREGYNNRNSDESIGSFANSSIILRSAKKARKDHVDRVNDDMMNDLRELQEEFDHMKSSYEQQIAILVEEKEALLLELQDWKSRAHASTATLQQLQMEVSRDLSPSASARSMVDHDLGNRKSDESVSEQSNRHSKRSAGKGGKKKGSSIRSKLTASMDQPQRNSSELVPMTQEAEAAAFSNRMNLRSAPTTAKRSPLGISNMNAQQQQPIFPPKSPSRPLSPSRARSPNATIKRSVSPATVKAPFVVKSVQGSGFGNDENSSLPLFGQVTNTAGLTEAVASDGSTYFKRLRSHFALRA